MIIGVIEIKELFVWDGTLSTLKVLEMLIDHFRKVVISLLMFYSMSIY